MRRLTELVLSSTGLAGIRLLTFAVVCTALIAGAVSFVLADTRDSIESYLDVLSGFAANEERSVTETLEMLRADVPDGPCTVATVTALGRVGLLPDGIGEIAYLPEGRPACSTRVGALPELTLQALGGPDAEGLGPFSLSIWFDRDLAGTGLGDITANLVSDGRFVVVVPFDIPRRENVVSSALPGWLALELGMKTQDEQWIHRAGAFHAEPAGGETGMLWQIGEYRLAACGTLMPYCVLASVNLATIFERNRALVLFALVIAPLMALAAGNGVQGVVKRLFSFEARFVRSLRRGRIECYYQPILQVADNRIRGIEVLARWRDVDGVPVSPDRFLEIVSRRNMTVPFTRAVIDTAMTEIIERLEAFAPLEVQFNVFPRDFCAATIVPMLKPHLERARWITASIEITEEDRFDPALAETEIKALREQGIKTYIDDFGIGYSNIGHLAGLSADGIKLDRSFAMAQPGSVHEVLMRPVIELVRGAGHRLIVEGVESEARLEELDRLGVDAAQGYFIAPPMPMDRLIEILSKRMSPKLSVLEPVARAS